MADFLSLSGKSTSSSAAIREATQEFVKITGISSLVGCEVKDFGGASFYVELLEKLSTYLPATIVISDISGFSRSDIENNVRVNIRLHIHLKVNDRPCCIDVDGFPRSFENAFLLQLNNILCQFPQPERYFFVYSGGLDYADEILQFAYINPAIYTELMNHERRYAYDDGITGQLDEKYSVSACELPAEEHTDSVIRATYEVSPDNSSLRFLRKVDNVVSYEINQFGHFYLTRDGFAPDILGGEAFGNGKSGQLTLHDDLLYCQSGEDMFLYDLTEKQFLVKSPFDVEGKQFHRLGNQLWEKYIWSVGAESDDSNYKRDGYVNIEYFAVNLKTKELKPMENSVRYSLDNGRVLLSQKPNSNSLHGLNRDGNIVWTYPIEGSFKPPGWRELKRRVDTMFGVHNQLIWFSINSGEIVALSDTTGEVKHLIDDVEHKGMFFDHTNSQIINEKLRIDLNSPSPSVETFIAPEVMTAKERYEKEGYKKPPRYVFAPKTQKIKSGAVSNKLLVIDDSNSIIALKDLEATQLEWRYAWQYYLFETVDHVGLISAMRHNNNLCVLDGCSTLHVFEINEQWM